MVLHTIKKSKDLKMGCAPLTRELIFLKMGRNLYIFQNFIQKIGFTPVLVPIIAPKNAENVIFGDFDPLSAKSLRLLGAPTF